MHCAPEECREMLARTGKLRRDSKGGDWDKRQDDDFATWLVDRDADFSFKGYLALHPEEAAKFK